MWGSQSTDISPSIIRTVFMLPAHKFPSALQQLRLPNDTQPFQAATALLMMLQWLGGHIRNFTSLAPLQNPNSVLQGKRNPHSIQTHSMYLPTLRIQKLSFNHFYTVNESHGRVVITSFRFRKVPELRVSVHVPHIRLEISWYISVPSNMLR